MDWRVLVHRKPHEELNMVDWIKDGGVFAWVMLGMSVVSLTFILERAWALRRSRVIASWIDGEQVFGPDGPSRLDAGAIVADADEARRRIM